MSDVEETEKPAETKKAPAKRKSRKKAPEAKAPEAKAPEAKAPEAKAPEVKADNGTLTFLREQRVFVGGMRCYFQEGVQLEGSYMRRVKGEIDAVFGEALRAEIYKMS